MLGKIRRSSLSDFQNIRQNGKIAIKLDENDKLVSVRTCTSQEHILLSTKTGKALRFAISKLRTYKGRSSDGVRGIRLAPEDAIISMTVLNGTSPTSGEKESYLSIPLQDRIDFALKPQKLEKFADKFSSEKFPQLAMNEQFILSITSNGYGKRSSSYEYKVINRGGVGVINIASSSKIGHLVATLCVRNTDEVMLITNKGKIIRCKVNSIRSTSRKTSGVILFKVDSGECVVSAALVLDKKEEEITHRA